MFFFCQSISHGDILLGEQHTDLFQYLQQPLLEQQPQSAQKHGVLQPLWWLAPVLLPPLGQRQHSSHLCQRQPSGPSPAEDPGSDGQQRVITAGRVQEQWFCQQEGPASARAITAHTLLHRQPSHPGAHRRCPCHGASPESGRVPGIGRRRRPRAEKKLRMPSFQGEGGVAELGRTISWQWF